MKKATEIKKDIKKLLGIAPIDYSLKWSHFSLGKSLDCAVKNPRIGLTELDIFLHQNYEEISYDEFSGEILGGGNTYISVTYDYNIVCNVDFQNIFIDFLKSGENIWHKSCWNPFCPKELRDLFCKKIEKETNLHHDYVNSKLGGLSRYDSRIKLIEDLWK